MTECCVATSLSALGKKLHRMSKQGSRRGLCYFYAAKCLSKGEIHKLGPSPAQNSTLLFPRYLGRRKDGAEVFHPSFFHF